MVIDECHFTYGAFNSSDYGLIFAHIDSNDFAEIYGEGTNDTIYNSKTKSISITHEDHSDAYVTFNIEIIQEDLDPFTNSEVRYLKQTLFNKTEFEKLYININDDCYDELFETINNERKRLYLNCRFVEPVKILDAEDRVIGFSCKVECDSIMFWQDAISESFPFSEWETENEFGNIRTCTVTIDTDLNDYTYPVVKFTTGRFGGNLVIWNIDDDPERETIFFDLPPNCVFTMKGNTNFISDGYYQKFSQDNFIRCVNGENRFRFKGNLIDMTFTWQNRRFM